MVTEPGEEIPPSVEPGVPRLTMAWPFTVPEESVAFVDGAPPGALVIVIV